MPGNFELEELKRKYHELQLRVTQFSGVEQELINTRDKLDQELVLYKRLNDFNRSALSDLKDTEFSRLVVESLIDILELEGALVYFYCKENENKIRFESEGIDSNIISQLTNELKNLFRTNAHTSGKLIQFKSNSTSELFPRISQDIGDGLLFSNVDLTSGGGVLLFTWVTNQNQPLFREISAREKNVFSVFAQQVLSIYINRLKSDKISEQMRQISTSELELKKLSLIATKTKNGVIIANEKGEIEWVNQAFTDITGYSMDEVIGEKPKNFLQSDATDPTTISMISEKLAKKEAVDVILVNKTKNKGNYFNHLEVIPIFDDEGKHINFIALQRDITNEVKSKEEILRINSRFELIANNAEIGVWEYDYQTKKITWNEILYKQYGISKDDELDLYDFWLHSILDEDRENVSSVSGKIVEGELDKQELTYRIIQHNTGEIRFLNCLITAERNTNGELIRLVGSSTDHTEEVKYVRQIEDGKRKIELINRDLERMVQDKTQRNLELAKTISDQEKLVTIGEIASGIAHDLNTPIGSIKIGAESIRSTLEDLFKNTLVEVSHAQIDFACDRAMTRQFELFVGGIQKRREMAEMAEFLREIDINASENTELLDWLIKCRFTTQDNDQIVRIISERNWLNNLKLIYQVQSIRSFLDTILSSSERTSKVVQDMRSYIKDKKSEEKQMVHLKPNIATVLNIFNYEIKRKAEIVFDVNESIQVLGFDIHLFQLWANLIKNAVESFEKEGGDNYLKIWSEESKNATMIHVENNGPKIPEEIQQKIFDKYFTTKSTKNGTGLGLSIVKKIVDEHNAKLSLSSTEFCTTFTVSFPK